MANLYNITLDKIEIATDKSAEIIKSSVCNLESDYLINWIIIPLLFIVFFLFLIRYKNWLFDLYFKWKGNKGGIKILYRMPNKKVKERIIDLDKFNTFKWGKRRYTLDRMHDFIFGYDKNNIPIFLYDYNFIMPMKLTTTEIKKELKIKLAEMSNDKSPNMITDKQISQLTLKIDSSILQTVYSKKLLSDLYSISGDSEFRQKLIWIGLALVMLIVAYYTGILESILAYLGVNLNA